MSVLPVTMCMPPGAYVSAIARPSPRFAASIYLATTCLFRANSLMEVLLMNVSNVASCGVFADSGGHAGLNEGRHAIPKQLLDRIFMRQAVGAKQTYRFDRDLESAFCRVDLSR